MIFDDLPQSDATCQVGLNLSTQWDDSHFIYDDRVRELHKIQVQFLQNTKLLNYVVEPGKVLRTCIIHHTSNIHPHEYYVNELRSLYNIFTISVFVYKIKQRVNKKNTIPRVDQTDTNKPCFWQHLLWLYSGRKINWMNVANHQKK